VEGGGVVAPAVSFFLFFVNLYFESTLFGNFLYIFLLPFSGFQKTIRRKQVSSKVQIKKQLFYVLVFDDFWIINLANNNLRLTNKHGDVFDYSKNLMSKSVNLSSILRTTSFELRFPNPFFFS